MQKGHIFRFRNSWFLKYYSVELVNGKRVSRRACQKLAPINDTYKVKSDVAPLAAKILEPINSGSITPESSLLVSDFIEHHYLPHCRRELRPSTVKDYTDVFKCHVKSRLGKLTLRDFRTVHGQRLIRSIDGIGHTSLLRVKSFLSGVFTYCKQEGILDGVNPMQGVKVQGRPSKPKMPVYDLGEIDDAIRSLVEPARTVFSVAAFTGLRVSELRGLRWSDFDGETLRVSRSVWRTHVNAPKTLESEATVPVLPVLSRALEQHRARCKNPTPDSYIFAGERRGAPLNLANLARRVIKPALEVKDIQWKGWHALRRGLASNLYALGVQPRVIQSILRHSNVSMTMQFYVQPDVDASRAAMKGLEDLFYPLG